MMWWDAVTGDQSKRWKDAKGLSAQKKACGQDQECLHLVNTGLFELTNGRIATGLRASHAWAEGFPRKQEGLRQQ